MNSSNRLAKTATLTAAAANLNQSALSASSSSEEFLRQLKSTDPAASEAAVDAAPLQQPTLLSTLAELLSGSDFELARRAKRAMQRIVRGATAPGSASNARSVERELIRGLKSVTDRQARSAILWMLSEVGHGEAVAAVAPYLTDAELREDARCVLLRIPDRKAVAALEAAHQSASADFKAALAYALNQRGKRLPEGSSPHTPVKQTTVTPLHPPGK